VELLIAAVLALPELLRSKRAAEPAEARQKRIAHSHSIANALRA